MAEKKTSLSAHAFQYALYIAGASVILMIISFALDLTNSRGIGILSWLIVLIGLFYSGFKYRDGVLNGYISFGRAFKVIFQTGLFYGLIMTAYSMLHYTVIDPGAIQEMIQYSLEKAVEASPSMTQQQLDAIRSLQENVTFTWWGISISQFFSGLFWGVIGGLLLSLIIKKEEANPSPFNQ
ncbi:MAG: DUF4199 domain-containing protein [Bacteroidales bacterium]